MFHSAEIQSNFSSLTSGKVSSNSVLSCLCFPERQSEGLTVDKNLSHEETEEFVERILYPDVLLRCCS